MTELAIHLPKPHAKQMLFRASKAKRKVIVAGRRGGKTTGAAMIAVEAFLKGKRVLEAAPTADQTSAFWDACKRALVAPIAAGIVRKNETERVLESDMFGRIRTKTAWDSNTLRGDYADVLILDEYSLMSPTAWDEVGAPMLLDNDGDAIFIFTPKRHNHAYTMYNKAKAATNGRMGAWHFTSFDNPHLSQAALAEITADMTDAAYRQEIMAEFLESEGIVFRNIAACMNAPLAIGDTHKKHRLVAGIDWAKQADFSTVSVGCVDCRVEVLRDRFNKIDYTFQRERIKALIAPHDVTAVLPERNSVGDPSIEMLIRDGLPIMNGPDNKPGFQTTAITKSQLIENLVLAFDKTEWQFQSDSIWTTELEAYEAKVSSLTGRSQYSAPDGMNDDTVIARALMLWAAEHSRVNIWI
jgi:hypothetical protein